MLRDLFLLAKQFEDRMHRFLLLLFSAMSTTSSQPMLNLRPIIYIMSSLHFSVYSKKNKMGVLLTEIWQGNPIDQFILPRI